MSLHNSPDKEYIALLEKYEPVRIVFGDGAFAQLGTELMLDRSASACFVFGGRSTAQKSGVYQDFINTISSFDLEAPSVSDIPPEPDTDDVRRIVEVLKDASPAAVIAVGGGSVMDAAKAAYLSWQTGMDVTELFGVDVASKKFPDRAFKRVFCIPTTSGTGSEVTPYANIVDREKGVKCLIMEKQIVPAVSFVEPAFTCSMPADLTATTALDAMVHSIESFLNTRTTGADPASDEWAQESVRLIRYALPKVLKDPDDLLSREMLSAAATLGGMCIATRPTSLPHLCSFSLYGRIAHGYAVAGFLPLFWRYYLKEEAVRAQTMRLAGIFPSAEKQSTPEDVVDAVEAFIRTCAKPLELNAELIEKIASDALANPMKLASAPRPVPPDDAARIIRAVLSGESVP